MEGTVAWGMMRDLVLKRGGVLMSRLGSSLLDLDDWVTT